MSSSLIEQDERHANYYGVFAYVTVVLTCYAGFWADQQLYGSEWMVPLVFALGAIHVAVAVLGGEYGGEHGRNAAVVYYGVQCSLVTAILVLSPIRGFMGILVLPLMSQAIFDLRPRYAALVGIYLFGLNIALFAVPYGWEGAKRAVLNFGAAFAFTSIFTVIARQAVVARRREAKLREEVEAANQQLRDQAAQAEDLATTRERNRVAREIHDGVGHYLTVVKTQLDAAAALLPAQPERAREAVVKAAKLTGDALDDVRRSVGALRAEEVRASLPEALRELTTEVEMPVTLRVEGEARALAPGLAHALFRSAQEGLTNVRKHAGATAAEVVLDFRIQDRVRLVVMDDGRGARGADDANGAGAANGGSGVNGPRAGGFGLVGIRERIEVLGGCVESGSRGEGGFALTVEVPA